MKHESDLPDSSGHVTAQRNSNHPLQSIELALEKSLDLLPRLHDEGDESARAELLYRMSLGFLELGLHHDVLIYATQAVEAARGRGAELLLCRAACVLGSAQQELGWHDEASRTLLDTLRLARALEAPEQVRDVLLCLGQLTLRSSQALHQHGDVHAAQATAAQARGYAEQALEIVRQPGRTPTPGDVLCQLGRCLVDCGQIEAAQAVLGDAHSQAVRHGDALLKLRADAGLAEALVAGGQHVEALPLVHQLQDSARELHDDEVQLRARHLLYQLHKARGDVPLALEHLEGFQVMQQTRAASLRSLQARLTTRRLAREQPRLHSARRVTTMPARDAWMATSTMAMLDERRTGSDFTAFQDPITGLGNRRHVERELPRLLALSQRRKATLCVAVVELDRLRTVNERLGRPVRNAVLKEMAEILHAHTRSADLVCRAGPDEFVIVMCDATRDGAREACERLRQAVQQHPWESIAESLSITASVGICEQREKLNAAQMLARADRALYFARSKGGNQSVLADDTL